MILILEVLDFQLELPFSVTSTKRQYIEEIKPYLYMHNAPSGNFKLELISDSQVLSSFDFDSNYIKEKLGTSDNYAHVYIPIPIKCPIEKGSYSIKLTATNYTPQDSAYIGWVKEYRDPFNSVSGDIVFLTDYPLSARIITRLNRVLL